jgi:hypothetical protein
MGRELNGLVTKIVFFAAGIPKKECLMKELMVHLSKVSNIFTQILKRCHQDCGPQR